ncbi:pantoate--beta-alanine ligase [Cellulomonas sp. NTE-D12]|uniref:pantoate--beta-alanine ligase n=1 Tax=Cellulomonas sp. NTE-D12 TaxID=2962632 RepID=UPI0030820C4A|nr:pantothenate synthetase [Cellulomonas sp. NTE-D12]
MTDSAPVLVHDVAQLWAALDASAPDRVAAPYGRAVVMTMGALHAGHLSLVRAAKELASRVVVTIFVNPLQFGPGEDLERYPRDLDGDLALLSGPGLLGAGDVVFAPTPQVMYPDGEPSVRVSAGPIGTVLEGAVRPGHFDGVLTVVLKLMHLTRPDVALFGRKDAQQLAAVRAMVRDLDVPVDVRGVPIVRDDDGLALSSRNAYLGPEDRQRALALSRSLAAGRERAAAGGAPDQVRAVVRAVLDEQLDEQVDAVDYVALLDPDTFTEVPDSAVGTAVLAVAARVGGTRLIDNTDVELIGR